jgi:hypothetical protein
MQPTDERETRGSPSAGERRERPFARPAGRGEYEVRQGECISSIAKGRGHFWKTIWDAPQNRELREARENPNIVLPGDRIHVPAIRPKEETGETERRHRFRRRGEPATLHITFLRNGVARANEPYEANIDGRWVSGTLDSEGKLQISVPSDAERGTVWVGEGNSQTEFPLRLRHLNPADSITGVQQRLDNLGFACQPTGELDSQTEGAVRDFQKKRGLEESGRLDQGTQDQLKESHLGV